MSYAAAKPVLCGALSLTSVRSRVLSACPSPARHPQSVYRSSTGLCAATCNDHCDPICVKSDCLYLQCHVHSPPIRSQLDLNLSCSAAFGVTTSSTDLSPCQRTSRAHQRSAGHPRKPAKDRFGPASTCAIHLARALEAPLCRYHSG